MVFRSTSSILERSSALIEVFELNYNWTVVVMDLSEVWTEHEFVVHAVSMTWLSMESVLPRVSQTSRSIAWHMSTYFGAIWPTNSRFPSEEHTNRI